MGKIIKVSNLKKTLRYLKKNGIRQAYYAMMERVKTEATDDYTYEPLSNLELMEQIEEGKRFHTKFSVLVPTFETKEVYLRAMIESVLDQTYGNFELILADASATDVVEQVVKGYTDPRIIYKRLKVNAGISANTNQALMFATGDYAGLLDHDDALTPDALYEMACCIDAYEKQDIQLQLLYSNEDKCDGTQSRYYEVNKKPEFNLDLILSNNYICHFMVMKRQLMQELGFRSVCDGAQDYDILLRAVSVMLGKDKQRAKKLELPIAHIDKVLYHWRCHDQSTAENPASKQYAYEAGRNAVRDFLREQGIAMGVFHSRHLGFYEIRYFPDIFTVRPDAGAVGTAVYGKNNKITGGIYDADGHCPYEGLKRGYSGECNRAAMVQDAYTLDVRTMRVRKELTELVKETLKELAGNDNNGVLIHGFVLKEDGTLLSRENFTEDEYKRISESICRKLREQGYRLLFLPEGSGL